MLSIDGIVLDVDYSIKHEYGGNRILAFEMSTLDDKYNLIREEKTVICDGQSYVLKAIDEQDETANIECDVNLDVFKAEFIKEFKTVTLTLSEVLQQILTDTDWTVINAELVSIRRSLEMYDICILDILEQCQKTYDVVYIFDTQNKIIEVVKPQNIQPTGAYITSELNIKSVDFKGDTFGFATRLYPYGIVDEETGEALTIASVNGGLEYIDNFDYSDKIITAVWRDERYIDSQSLKDNAIEMLKLMAKPNRCFQFDLIDIAKMDSDYDFLSIKLYDVVTFLDTKRNEKSEYRVVEYTEYPHNPQNNSIILSSLPQKITGTITQTANKIEEINTDLIVTKNKVNSIDRDLDTINLRVAETYTKGETDVLLDGQINISKNQIMSSVSQSYVTKNDNMQHLQDSNANFNELNTTINTLSTKLTQTENSFNFEINNIKGNTTSSKVENTTVKIDESGVTVGKSTSEINTTLSENGVQIKSKENIIANFNSEKAEVKNLYVNNEVVFGNLRIMKAIDNENNRCHIHFIG